MSQSLEDLRKEVALLERQDKENTEIVRLRARIKELKERDTLYGKAKAKLMENLLSAKAKRDERKSCRHKWVKIPKSQSLADMIDPRTHKCLNCGETR